MNTAIISSLAIQTEHVKKQFNRRHQLQGARFILDEIAQRMLDRLHYIKIQPKTILDAGAGPGYRLNDLSHRYPEAQLTLLDHNEQFIQLAQSNAQRKGLGGLFKRLKGQKETQFVVADLAQSTLEPQSLDLIWSNMALHWHPQPHEVIAEWQRLVRTNGLVMFSCFAPMSFIEIRNALGIAQLDTETLSFVDMHDLGDLLLEHGFMDPVMDQELITLTYKTPEKLLADVRALGGNANPNRRAALLGKQAYQRLLDALESQRNSEGLITLTLEVAYGHAWRSAITRKEGETRISLDSLFKK